MKQDLELDGGGVVACSADSLGGTDPTVRAAFGVWNDVVYALRKAALELQRLGEHRQAEALITDAQMLVRRAQLHLRSLAAGSRDDGCDGDGGHETETET